MSYYTFYEFCTLDFLNPLKRNIQTSYDFLWDYCSAPFWSSDVKDAGGSRIRPPIKIVCTVLTSTYIHTFESTWPEDQRTLTLDHNLVPGWYLPQTPPRIGIFEKCGDETKTKSLFLPTHIGPTKGRQNSRAAKSDSLSERRNFLFRTFN